MYQIDGPDAVAAKPTKKPPVTSPGWFDGGDPINDLKATMVTRDWLNTVQAELKNAIETAGITLNRNDDTQLAQALQSLIQTTVQETINTVLPDPASLGVPVGTIIAFYGSSAPSGYFACDGSSFNASQNNKLYAILGKSTTPDLRGCFLRGLGGAAGNLGAKQEDAGRDATGDFIADNSQVGTDGPPPGGGFHGVFAAGQLVNGYDLEGGYGHMPRLGGYLTFSLARAWGSSHIASEFRPVNVAILYCIKHD
jgi:hypothetical protein